METFNPPHMTEQQAKHARKLNQAVQDAKDVIPEKYTPREFYPDLVALIEAKSISDQKKLSTKMIAGLLRWQVDNL